MKKIPLYGKNGIGKFALVDDEDYNYLMKWRWFCVYAKNSSNYYVICNYNYGNNNWTNKKMHYVLMNKKEGFVVDHIDGNGLNNQKLNLRYCTIAQNGFNKKKYKNGSSVYPGVTLKKASKEENNKWVARIQINKNQIILGKYPLTLEGELQAWEVYKVAAKKYFGEFARENPLQNHNIPPANHVIVKKEIIYPNTEPGIRAIYLSKGKFALVDESDYEWLNKWKWCTKEYPVNNYATRHLPRVKGEKRVSVKMHNFIMNVPNGMVVDHINRNGLDNTRKNLRVCSQRQNSYNKIKKPKLVSEFIGVNMTNNRFVSKINTNGKSKHLGCYPPTREGEIMAAKAYNQAAILSYGIFAVLNTIP